MQEFAWKSFTTEARGGSIEEKEETPVHNSGISFQLRFCASLSLFCAYQ